MTVEGEKIIVIEETGEGKVRKLPFDPKQVRQAQKASNAAFSKHRTSNGDRKVVFTGIRAKDSKPSL